MLPGDPTTVIAYVAAEDSAGLTPTAAAQQQLLKTASVEVSYLFGDWPVPTIYGKTGLPAAPFRASVSA